MPPTPQLEPTNAYGTMFSLMFSTISSFIAQARCQVITAYILFLKTASKLVCKLCSIFVSLFKTHGLDQSEHQTPENVTF